MNLQSLHGSFFDRKRGEPRREAWSANSEQGVVASAHYLASAAGAEMLRKGGNAFDAAIATSFALAVCEPAGSGLGGMATMVIYHSLTSKWATIESACLAPHSATAEKLSQPRRRYRGYLAIAVPSHVAAMQCLYRGYASLSIAQLLEPAIQIAEEGFPVTATLNLLLRKFVQPLRRRSAGEVFLAGRQPIPIGGLLQQPALARTLRQLSARGLEEFYGGEIGREIVRDMQAGGGFIDETDMQDPPKPLERTPVSGPFSEGTIRTVGPPAGGLALLQLATLFTETQRGTLDLSDPDDVVMAARLIRCVRKQRRKFRLKQFADELGNAGRLLDADYNRELLSKLLHMPSSSGPTASGPTSTGATPSTGETSQVSIMDRWGNAISLTQSIERNFGSCIVTPELGFCYNGYLRAFKIKNKKHPYYLRPGTPARSNASPAIVETNGRPRLVIGSTGSERIASGIFCTLMRLFGSDPFTAVDGARIHCTPEGTVYYEDGFVEPVIRSLSAAGFQLKRLERRAFHLGAVQLVVSDDSQFTGVADPRRDGAVVGI